MRQFRSFLLVTSAVLGTLVLAPTSALAVSIGMSGSTLNITGTDIAEAVKLTPITTGTRVDVSGTGATIVDADGLTSGCQQQRDTTTATVVDYMSCPPATTVMGALNGGDDTYTLGGDIAAEMFITGGAGNDGNDWIEGGFGNDRLVAGAGNDHVFGEAGNDRLDESSDTGFDWLSGGLGADTIDYLGQQTSGITIHVGKTVSPATDTDQVADDVETIVGSAGNDNITGGATNETISGSWGNDRLDGDLGNDSLDGGWGNDTLAASAVTGSDGRDYYTDGAGDHDVISYEFHSTPLVLSLSPGNYYSATGENDTITAGFEMLIGGKGADTLTGTKANDIIYGGGGNDYFPSSLGNDELDGGAGNDRFDQGKTPDGAGQVDRR